MKGRSYIRWRVLRALSPPSFPCLPLRHFEDGGAVCPRLPMLSGSLLTRQKAFLNFSPLSAFRGLVRTPALSGVLLVSMLLNGGYGYEPQP